MGLPAGEPGRVSREQRNGPCRNTCAGQLLLVHGLIDENVHFRHTARLVNALIRRARRTS